MRISVAGRTGQVATALSRFNGQQGLTVELFGRPELNLADKSKLALLFANNPDIIMNTAAYTAVDQAEEEEEIARSVNATGVEHLALECANRQVPLVHLSTDYVYNLPDERPATEDSPIGPKNAYGRTKWEGEQAIRRHLSEHVILRTAWVFGPSGQNFVKTMLRLAGERDALSIVSDQYGNPTAAADIAAALVLVAQKIQERANGSFWGTYNFAGRGYTNWAGFARAIFKESERQGGPTVQVVDMPSSQCPTPALRPANSRLDTARFESTFGSVPSWRPSLAETIAALQVTS